MRPFKFILTPILIAFLWVAGCETLRFAPSESQKLAAFQSHLLAQQIADNGTRPDSPAAKQLVAGTAAALAYTGVPSKLSTADLDAVIKRAQHDAAKRPAAEEVWDTVDGVISLGIAVAGLVGGAYGIKGVEYLRKAKVKSKALREIVKGNELFKRKILTGLDGPVKPQVLEAFATAQNESQSGIETKQIVTEMKS